MPSAASITSKPRCSSAERIRKRVPGSSSTMRIVEVRSISSTGGSRALSRASVSCFGQIGARHGVAFDVLSLFIGKDLLNAGTAQQVNPSNYSRLPHGTTGLELTLHNRGGR